MSKLLVSASPHIRSAESISTIMWTVVVALLPAGMLGVYVFGRNALLLIAISVATAAAAEFAIQKLRGRKTTLGDGSAIVTGLLMAYIISPGAPWYVPMVGSLFAIAVAKFAFGGLGMNIWNPALAGRAFVLSGYIIAMTATWIYPSHSQIIGGLKRGGRVLKAESVDATSTTGAPTIVDTTTAATSTIGASSIVDTTSAATPRAAIKDEIKAAQDRDWRGWRSIRQAGSGPRDWLKAIYARNKTSYIDLFIGTRGGCIGETSTILLLLGGLFLIFRRVIAWQIPIFYIGAAALLGWALPIRFPGGAAWFAGDPLFSVMSGGLMLGAFFMATDMVTSPVTRKGMIIFAIGCGVITAAIRSYGGYPEGVNYAILLMNTAVPLIDRYIRPRKYGAAA